LQADILGREEPHWFGTIALKSDGGQSVAAGRIAEQTSLERVAGLNPELGRKNRLVPMRSRLRTFSPSAPAAKASADSALTLKA